MFHRVVIAAVLLGFGLPLSAAASDYFAIRVVDAATGRGVPLIELETVHNVVFVTDSAGVIAFREPGLMGKEVFFHVRGHGYDYRKDGFGYRGVRLTPTPGGRAVVKVRRVNVAERLYRVTGGGVYRDSVLCGLSVPLRSPLLSGKVLGQDSVLAVVYRGKVHWFWGDTNRVSYPLGNFAMSGAVSELPSKGGLDPDVGVDLEYFVDERGFSKKMCPRPGPGPVWVDGLVVVPDASGARRLVAGFSRMKDLGTVLEKGIVAYNDEKELFEKVADFDLSEPFSLRGHPFRAAGGEAEYIVFSLPHPSPFPNVRVRARLESLLDPDSWEVFTCFAPGSSYDPEHPRLDRRPDGRLRYGWKRRAAPLSTRRVRELVRKGRIRQSESWLSVRDVETGAPLEIHAGSVFYNAFRRRWVLIGEETGGKPSFLGEIWYAEADTPVGPWVYARRIVTHDHYSFYNPTQHPFFDKDGGRKIYFEGTYASTFSAAKQKTPRYDYNQILYRLDLEDERVVLPCAVYRVGESGAGALCFGAGAGRESLGPGSEIAFFAVEPDRKGSGLVAVRALGKGAASRLAVGARGRVVFQALAAGGKEIAGAVPLWEFRSRDGRRVMYSTRDVPGLARSPEPTCRVWENPGLASGFDFGMRSAARE